MAYRECKTPKNDFLSLISGCNYIQMENTFMISVSKIFQSQSQKKFFKNSEIAVW